MGQNAVYPFYKGWKAGGLAPAVGYYLYTYESGTTTPKTTYSDSALTTPNANPIVLNGNGEATIFLGSGAYRFDLKTPAGALVNTFQPIQGTGVTIDTVENIAALKVLATSGLSLVNVLGYDTPGDGGGGQFYFDSTSSTTDDGGITITPTSAPTFGRWKRLYSGPVNVRWFGAKGDGVTADDTAILKGSTFVQALSNGGTLYFPESSGGYLFTTNPSFGTKTAVKLDDGAFFTSTAIAITFASRFIKSRSKAFGPSVGLVTFSYTSNTVQVQPEWWGGKADNTTDNLAAFVAAFATLAASGMGVLSLGRGTYKYGTASQTTSLIYNGPITGPAMNGLIMRGQGCFNTTLHYLGTGDGLTFGSNINGLVIENLRLYTLTGARALVFTSNPSIAPLPDVGTTTLAKLDIRGWLSDAISVGLCVLLTTRELQVLLNKGNGIVFELSSPKATTWQDTNSWFHENEGIGIVLNGPICMTLTGTTSDSNSGIATALGTIKYAGYTLTTGGTYVACGIGNLGMKVFQGGTEIGTLSHFDNITQEWVINCIVVPATSGALVTKSATGAGVVIRVTGLTAVVGDLTRGVSQGGVACGTLTSYVTIDSNTQDWTLNVTAGQEIVGGSSLTIPTGTAGTGTAGGSSTTTATRQKNSIGLFARNMQGLNLSGGDFENHIYGIYLENVYDSKVAPGKILTQGTNAWGLYVAGSCSRISMGGFSVDVQAGGAGDIYFGSETIGLVLIGGHGAYTFTNRSRNAMVVTAENASPLTMNVKSTGLVPWTFQGYHATGALLQVGSGSLAGYAGYSMTVNGWTKDFYLDQATGDLFFVSSGLAKYIRLLGSATDRANQRLFWSTSNGTKAVGIGATEGNRAGANVESDFSVDLYDDAGALLFNGMTINRAAYWVAINLGKSVNTCKLGGTWQTTVVPVGTVNAAETDLFNVSVPANALSRDGDSLEIVAFGTYAANANTKRVKAYFGAGTLLNTGAIAFNNSQWVLRITLMRISGTTQISQATFGTNDPLLYSVSNYNTPAETLSGVVVLRITGAATTTDDIILTGARVEWKPAA